MISIIIPVFNIEKKINVFCNHIYQLLLVKNIEIIIVDDKSKDNTLKKLRTNFNNFKNLKLLRLNKNRGPGIARNHGIKFSKNKFIIFLDSDDQLIIKNLEKVMKSMPRLKKYDVIMYNYEFKYSIGKIKRNMTKSIMLKKYLRTEIDMPCLFYIYRKSFLLKNKIIFKRGIYEDIFFMLQVFFNLNSYKKIIYKVYKKIENDYSITNQPASTKHLYFFKKSSMDKYKFIKKKIKLKMLSNSFLDDLQYGLRGDYNFAKKIILSNKENLYQKKRQYEQIKGCYRKIISDKYKIQTKYDKVVTNDLFS